MNNDQNNQLNTLPAGDTLPDRCSVSGVAAPLEIRTMIKVKETQEIIPLCASCTEDRVKDGSMLGFGEGFFYRAANTSDDWTEIAIDINALPDDYADTHIGKQCDSCGDTIGENDY